MKRISPIAVYVLQSDSPTSVISTFFASFVALSLGIVFVSTGLINIRTRYLTGLFHLFQNKIFKIVYSTIHHNSCDIYPKRITAVNFMFANILKAFYAVNKYFNDNNIFIVHQKLIKLT